jgi:WbqC-like protein family
MAEKILLSSAYFPPINYLSIVCRADKFFIEKEENYLKQTYRNRCLILTANGPSSLSVPVLSGSSIKSPVRDIKIDYSKRWQQVHIRALISSYKSSAFFEYYFEDFEKIIKCKPAFLIDLNSNTLETVMRIIGISKAIEYTNIFEQYGESANDFRKSISPKKNIPGNLSQKEYYQVFNYRFGFVSGLSILDLIFNVGPDSLSYLSENY